jgi:predicted unusual protein kinase regulating ubiquinone biosynthesis (AarF/ABC1/UbiB family)
VVRSSGSGSDPGDRRTVALVEELGTQLGRMRGAGPKLRQFLSMMALDPPATGRPLAAPGDIPAGVRAVPFGRVRQVIEQELGTRVGRVFEELEEAPFALASLGQVHRARTRDGERVAVKVQHPGVAEAVEADLRNLGLVGPILKRLAPRLDAGGVLGEIRERISDELDYELEAQHQRRLGRLLRGHPDVRVPRVHTELSTRRVLVSEYVNGLGAEEIKGLGDAERDRVGEIAFRFFVELAWREGIVAGDPHPDHCILCPDGRLCQLDFGLVRDLDPARLEGERELMAALAAADAPRLHRGLAGLGYLPDPAAVDPQALLDRVAVAGEWLLAPGFRRLDPAYVARILELGYSPRSPLFPFLRRMSIPPPTLLLRRMEVQLLSLLGVLRAGADWAAIAARAR